MSLPPSAAGNLAIVDSHLHLWDPSANAYPWLVGERALGRSFLPEDVPADGVEGFIVVEAGCADGRAELDWLTQLAERWPAVRGVVAHVPLELGPAAASLLAETARHPLTVGVRRNAQDEPPGFLLADSVLAGVRELAAYGLPFDACVREHQIPELTQLADRCPEATFVLDHLGKPGVKERRRQPWFDQLAALAQRPNVVVKLSGLTTEADHEHWHPDDITPYLTHAIDVFGPERCLFGSDWPVATLAATYQQWLDLVLAATADLTATQRSAVFAGTAGQIYHRTAPKEEA
jgi:L-fuconolactonase